MPGENFKPSSVESDLNACLDQKMHLKSHRWLGSPFCWSTALPKLHSVKPAMPLAFKFGSSTIEHHLTSKELKIFKIFVLLNFKRAESLLGKSDRRQLCTSACLPNCPTKGLPAFESVCTSTHMSTSLRVLTRSWKPSCTYLSYMVPEFTTEVAGETLPHHLPVSLCSAVPITSLARIPLVWNKLHTTLADCAFHWLLDIWSSHSPVQDSFASEKLQHKQGLRYFSLESYMQRLRLNSPHQPPPLQSSILHK